MSEENTKQGQDIEQAIDEATDAVSAQAASLDGESAPIGIESLLDVPVRVTVQIGRTRLSLGELVQLRPGALLPLDREAHEPADILVNGKIVARGEVVTIDNTYGVRITDLAKDD
jgi:flagellar motor switch protein FliN